MESVKGLSLESPFPAELDSGQCLLIDRPVYARNIVVTLNHFMVNEQKTLQLDVCLRWFIMENKFLLSTYLPGPLEVCKVVTTMQLALGGQGVGL
jgi:hypothetical protein